MPCYTPLSGFYSGRRTKNGKPEILVGKRVLSDGAELKIPCGQCIGCRLERSRQWAVRCVHEASLHRDNCFVTFTYSPEHLPKDGSLDLRHFQLFMKRLRKRVGKVRFFHCGEYGENFGRPHYHAILFGYDFRSDRSVPGFSGAELAERDWKLGLCHVGDASFDSAAYVARYCTKKVNGRAAVDHYVDRLTGVLRCPEYATMSRRPGIAGAWFDKYFSDVYPKDCFHFEGRELRPPKFYDRKFELVDSEVLLEVKTRRVSSSDDLDNRARRLKVKEACAVARSNLYKRSYEYD